MRYRDIALWGLVALVLCAISVLAGDRLTFLHQSAGRGLALLAGDAYIDGDYRFYLPMFQNRVLVPFVQTLFMSLGLSAVQAFLGVYFLTAWGLLMGAYWLTSLVMTGVGKRILMVLYLGLTLMLAFNERWIHGTEFLDVAVILSAFFCAMRGYRGWLFLLVMIGVLNREAAVYGGLVWVAIRGPWLEGRRGWWECLWAVGVMMLAYAWVLAVRYGLGGETALTQWQTRTIGFNVARIGRVWHSPWEYGWPWLWLGLFIPAILLIIYRARQLTLVALTLLAVAMIIIVSCFLLGLVNEVRIFLPAFAVFWLVVMLVWRDKAVAPKSPIVPFSRGMA